MSFSYYVYYRVNPDRAVAARERVLRALEAIAAGTGVVGRLMKKRGEPNLWMEVYENVADCAEFERRLAKVFGQSLLAEYLQPDTRRHLECFEES